MQPSKRPLPWPAILTLALGLSSLLSSSVSAQTYIFGRADFATGSNPVSIATGDFNGDGRPDVVVTDFGNGHHTDTISVLLGRPDGTFAPKVDYPTGEGPNSVAVGDFNRDGKLDLVVVNTNSDTVSIFLGNGDGTFQPKVDYPTGAEPLQVVTGDFNGDGKLDLAVVNLADNTVSILLGNGDGTFQPKVDYGAANSPFAVTTGDFNGDGKLDLAVVVGGGVAILLSNGDGTFQPEHTFNVTFPSRLTTPVAIIVGDFNSDHMLDLAIAAGDVFVLLGNGDGTFRTAVDYTINGSARGVTAVDLKGDGKLDLVAATGITVSVLAGNGDGTFQNAVYYSVATGAQAIATGDFNGDGRLDVATATLSSFVSILLGNGDGTFQTHAEFATGMSPWAVAASDFNGDGKLDLAVANNNGASVSVLLGNGNGTFQSHVNYAAASGPESVVAADFNGDGHPDLAVANNGAGTVSVLLGNGDGTFRTHVDYATGPMPTTGPTSVVAGDFNGDGKLDLAVANGGTGSVAVLLGKGDGTFQSAIVTTLPSNPSIGFLVVPGTVVAGDFNRDGKLDLAVGDMGTGTVWVLLGNGDGTFQTPVAHSVFTLTAMTIGDFNGDGKLDLAVVSPATATYIAVLLGNGDGTFQAPVSYPAALGVTSIIAGDVNGDGKLDLIACDNFIGDVSIFLGNGDGTFKPYFTHLIGLGLRGITTGDFSGNGGRGIAVGSSASAAAGGASTVSILNAVPVIGLFPTSLSFLGQTVGKTSSAETVTVSNPGSTLLKVTSVNVTGNFAETNSCTTLAAGASCTINVTFTPAAKGSANGVLTVTDDAPGGSQVVALTGSAGPLATLSTTSLTFQTQVLGTVSAAQKVTLSNPGSDALSITSIATKGDFGETNTCGMSVAAGSNCVISVTFAPTASGARTGSLVITDNAPGSPQTVNLTGTAIAPVVQVSPASLSFTGQLLGSTSAALSVTLSNQSPAPLTLTKLAASGDFAIASSGTTCTTTTMPSPSSCTIAVTFTPTATGTRTGTLTITDNTANSPQTVALTGSGEDFSISAAVGFPTSATITAGLSTTYNLSLVPAGGFNSTVTLACGGAPPAASCSIVPASLTLSGSAPSSITVFVSTLARSTLPARPRGGLRRPGGLKGLPLAAWWIALGAVAVLVSLRRRRRRRVWAVAARLAIVLATAALLWTACGRGGGTPGTPAGTYTLTITGTSASGTVTLKHTLSLTLTVN